MWSAPDRKGQSVSLAMTAMVLVLALALSWLFKYKNSLKDRMAPERADELRQMGLEAVGDNHPGMCRHARADNHIND